MRNVEQTHRFQRKYKKLTKHDKKVVNDVIKKALKDPEKGNPKKGNLSGYFTVSFKLHRNPCRLLYCFDEKALTLVEFGSRENFYR